MDKQIIIPSLKLKKIQIELIGLSPYISHAWSDKAKKQMRDKQMGKSKQGKHDIKNPEGDFVESLYWIEGKPEVEPTPKNIAKFIENGRFGIPSVAFKSSFVRAATDVGQKMTDMRRLLHVSGELTEIIGKPEMREDMVTVGMKAADLRYRGYFNDWKVLIEIEYNSALINEENILNLINTAGYGVGVGDWRPEKNGQYGRFKIGENVTFT